MLPFERCRRCKFRKSEVFPSCFAGGDSGYNTCHNFIDKGSFEPTIFLRNGKWYGTVKTKSCETREEAEQSLKDILNS